MGPVEDPSPLQMFTGLGRRSMGALTFGPIDGPVSVAGNMIDLDRLHDEMLRHLAGEATPWMVKFHGPDDSVHQSSIEATYLQMAARSGVTVCEHRVLTASSGTCHLAVRRFDRTATADDQPLRTHMASAAGLLERYPERDHLVSSADVIRLTRRVTGDGVRRARRH